ncbi:MAG: autotransporter domain-containing protein, partial [Pontiellaceae bacterium]|nr:autotransporter domain-containing protein [Pontiellaceae bacterium]
GTVDVEGGSMLKVDNQLYVGTTNNSENVVTISDAGAVFLNNTTDLVISNIAGSTNEFNEVNVDASGRLLIGGDVNATDFIAISNLNFASGAVLGVGGTLTIEDSAIEDGLNVLLDDGLSASNAAWTTGEIYIGDISDDNSLTLTNGAKATASDIIYIGNKADASGNSLNVYGSNSVLTAGNKVFVGFAGDENNLTISDGGTATAALDLKVGVSSGAEKNSIVVGTNSTLTVSRNLIVGSAGAKNTFTAEDGATVDIAGDLTLGESSASNTLNILTNGTQITVHGDVEIGDAGGSSNHLNIQDGSAAFDQVLTIGTSGDSNHATIAGTNGVLTAQTLTIGDEGKNNYLKITSGGSVAIASNVTLGVTGDGNYIEMSDSNSTFTATQNMVIGQAGSENQFKIYGGTMKVENNLYLGNSADSEANSILISGEQAILEVADSLYVGSSVSSNNSVTVKNGGTLFASAQENIVMGDAENNLLTVANGGTLKTYAWDFAALTNSATNIVFDSGATLQLMGTLDGTNMVEGGLNIVLDGTNANWTATDIYVGKKTGNNSLTLTNGASALAVSDLYIGYVSSNNLVTVEGNGSVLTVGHDLSIGTDTNKTAYNTLEVLSGGSLIVSNDVSLFYGANLKIGSTSQATVLGDYEQDRYSTLTFGISSNQVQPNLAVGGTMALASSASVDNYPTIKVYDEGIAESNVITIVKAGNITIDGTAASTSLLEANIATNLLLGFDVTLSNGVDSTYIMLDNFIQHSIGQAGNLDGQLMDVADSITLLKAAGDSNAVAMAQTIAYLSGESQVRQVMDNYYGSKMSSAPAHNAINSGLNSVAEQLTKRADNTRARVIASRTAPSGAAGPHMPEQDLQGWITGYKSWISKSSGSGFDGYDGSINGFLIGGDVVIDSGLLVGAAAGSGSASINKDNGGDVDTRTTVGSIYASAGTDDWFADASLILAKSSADTTMGSTFNTTGSFDAKNVAVYFGGGKEIIGNYLIFTPQASLLGNYYSQDGYTESSTTAVARHIDGLDTLYVQGSIGCNVGFYSYMGDTVIKPEIRAFWLHEFNAREEDLNYSLVGASDLYNLQLQAPEEDIIKLGAGVAAKMGEYLELRADLDTRRASGGYSDYTVLGSIRYQF